MEPAVWLERLADAVREIVPDADVDIAQLDSDTMTFARGRRVCTVHTFSPRTAGIMVSNSSVGVGGTQVEHGEEHREAVDELSLITLPRAIAAALQRE